MEQAIIDQLNKDVKWLETNAKSDNILLISTIIDHLAILSASLGTKVTEAYALMNNLEDDYKQSVAQFVVDYDGSNAAAERKAEVKFKKKKEDWTKAKNAYKRLQMLLDRTDIIIDCHRQRVSVLKNTELKNL